ncbi:MAG: hypothetical protein V1857_00505 [archaeon]
MRIAIAASPAVFILALTIITSLVTGHPEDLFLSLSTSGILIRFVLVVFAFSASISVLPSITALAGRVGKNSSFFGQLVKSETIPHTDISLSIDLVFRPMQGIAISLIFAERFLNFLEYSAGASYISMLVRSTVFVFMMANPLISLLLSFMWTLDDLGVKVYDWKSGEVRLLSSTVGIILPLITGAIGTVNIFHRTFFMDALIDLLGILMVLYPPYLLFVLAHHEFVRRRGADLSKTLPLEFVETRMKVHLE